MATITTEIPADLAQTYTTANLPAFSVEVTYRDGAFVARSWQSEWSSVQGQVWQGYMLKVMGTWRVTKRGALGRFTGNENYSGIIGNVHQLWLSAGKPAQFYYCER